MNKKIAFIMPFCALVLPMPVIAKDATMPACAAFTTDAISHPDQSGVTDIVSSAKTNCKHDHKIDHPKRSHSFSIGGILFAILAISPLR